MHKLNKPPYSNWWWRRRGLNGDDGVSPIDPATLNPSEHYNEATWIASPLEWRDVADGADRSFDNVVGVPNPITQNDLLCYEGSADIAMNWLTSLKATLTTWKASDEYMTFYFVVRWDGNTTDYVLEWLGDVGDSNLVLAMTTGDRVFFKMIDSSGNILQLYPVTVLSSGWQVWSFRYQNLTNDAVATWYNRQSDGLSVSQSTWVKSGMGDTIGTSRIFSNNDLSLRWDGAIAEIILFRDNHSANTISRVNQFLQNKWDIGLS